MNGRTKIESAFCVDGTSETPAVICYEGIFARDHWRQFTNHPWWYRETPGLERQMAWRRDLMPKPKAKGVDPIDSKATDSKPEVEPEMVEIP